MHDGGGYRIGVRRGDFMLSVPVRCPSKLKKRGLQLPLESRHRVVARSQGKLHLHDAVGAVFDGSGDTQAPPRPDQQTSLLMPGDSPVFDRL